MEETAPKPEANHDRRSKAQLLQELNEAYELLQKQEDELAARAQALQQAQAKIESLEKLNEQMAVTEREFAQARANLVDMTNQAIQLEREIEDLKRVNQKIWEENKKLRSYLPSAEGIDFKEIETAKRELRESERQRLHLEARIRDLEKTIQTLEQKLTKPEEPEEPIVTEITAPKATFHLHLYPRQGHYQGRIEHPLSKDKKAFRGLDQDAIIEFISRHLPRLEGQIEEAGLPLALPSGPVAEPETAASEKTRSVQPDTTPAEPRTPLTEEVRTVPVESLQFRQLNAIPAGMTTPYRILKHDNPFRVHVVLELGEQALKEQSSLALKVMIYAKQLGSSQHRLLGETTFVATQAGTFALNIECIALPSGFHHLQALATFPSAGTEPAVYADFIESELLHVY